MERRAVAAAVARHRRDRLCAAEQGRPAQDPRRQFHLSQQRHSDLCGEAGRRGRECRSVVTLSPSFRPSLSSFRGACAAGEPGIQRHFRLSLDSGSSRLRRPE